MSPRLPLVVLFVIIYLVIPRGGMARVVSDLSEKTPGQFGFMANQGQVHTPDGKPRTDIGFRLAVPGMTVFVGNDARLHYQFNKFAATSRLMSGFMGSPAPNQVVTSSRVDVILAGANPHPEVVTDEVLPGSVRYYRDGLQRMDVAGYRRIVYKNVYPGIDWELIARDGRLKYNFIVRKEGRVSDIRLRFEGASALAVDAEGKLQITTGGAGSITEQHPYSYQQEQGGEVSSSFVLRGNELGFETGTYNGTLVIDPEITWATYFGGGDMEEVNKLRTDAAGNVFLTGITRSASDVATAGAFQQTYVAGYDAFLAAFTPSGQLSWATYFGGSGDDYAFSLVVDHSGRLVISGATTSSAMASAGSHQPVYAGDSTYGVGDAFVAKFDASGQLIWSTYIGGDGTDCANAVAVDAADNIYVGGYTNSTAGITTNGVSTLQGAGSPTVAPDAFLAKMTPGGSMIWSEYYGGAGNDLIAGLAVDASGSLFAVGETSSPNLATNGSAQSLYSGGFSDAFVARFNSNGNREWCSFYGTSAYDHPTDIAVANGHFYICGSVYTGDLITTPGAWQPAFGGGPADGFIADFSVAGQLNWTTYCGGEAFDQVNAATVDSQGNLLVTGITGSTVNMFQAPGSGKHAFTANGTSADGFMAKYNCLGQRLWGSYYAGVGKAAGCYGRDQIYFAGYTVNGGLATSGTYQQANNGLGDIYLLKIKEDTSVFILQPFLDTALCAGGVFRLSYGVNNRFQQGNQFRVLLSDSMGSFAAPVIIGTMNGTDAGNVLCTIPQGMPAGKGYRVRIAASLPVDTSATDGTDIRIFQASPVLPVLALSSVPQHPSAGVPVVYTATLSGNAAMVTYSWLRNGVPVPGANGNVYGTTAVQGDQITAVAHFHLPCATRDSVVSNAVSTGIGTVAADDRMLLYPDPNNGTFTLQFSQINGPVSVRIVNVLGQVIYQQSFTISGSQAKQEIRAGKIPAGHYLLTVATGRDERISRKLTVAD